MITEQMIDKEFIHRTMTAGIKKIYAVQENVVATQLHTRSGNLKAHLASRPFTAETSQGGVTFYMRIFPYLRFLDIQYSRGRDRVSKHRRAKLALYNRVVWGVLYHETFPELIYGMSEDIRKGIKADLEKSLNPE